MWFPHNALSPIGSQRVANATELFPTTLLGWRRSRAAITALGSQKNCSAECQEADHARGWEASYRTTGSGKPDGTNNLP
jgi:hypothetical protein